METKYGLDPNVKYCKVCTISNQRPSSVIETKHKATDKKPTIFFDEEGVCSACRYHEVKVDIDWKKREDQLVALCDQHRSKDGSYDCIIPGSGGKDSAFTSHILKYKYGMNPLTVTWAPHQYTQIGWKNFQSWIHSGLDNMLYTPNGRAHRLFTKLAFLNLCHPFQPFIIGQRHIGPRFSAMYNIPLVFYGENQAEYGNAIGENEKPTMNPDYFTAERDISKLFIGGLSVEQILEKYGEEYKLQLGDFEPYLPVSGKKLKDIGTEVHYLGYYLKWDPQECFYYAVENTGFESNTERTEGSYSKYSSIDDKIDPLHYWTTLMKFGLGRASYDSSQEIRNNKITREEGVALVKKFDQEFPKKFLPEMLEYMDITEEQFWKTCDDARPEHIWVKDGDTWKLRHEIS